MLVTPFDTTSAGVLPSNSQGGMTWSSLSMPNQMAFSTNGGLMMISHPGMENQLASDSHSLTGGISGQAQSSAAMDPFAPTVGGDIFAATMPAPSQQTMHAGGGSMILTTAGHSFSQQQGPSLIMLPVSLTQQPDHSVSMDGSKLMSGSTSASGQQPPFEQNFNVLSEDKRTMLSIPSNMIEPTSGSRNYLQQGNSACYTFRFQLCRSFRQQGRCVHRHNCAFIHSKHVTDNGLAPLVSETVVHQNMLLSSPSRALYPRHAEGVTLQVYDSVAQKNVAVDSGCLYVTHGSSAAFRAALSDQEAPPHVTSALASVRLQFCLHFDKGLCARGNTCNFVHRVRMEDPSAEQTLNLSGLQIAPTNGHSTPPAASASVLGNGTHGSGSPVNQPMTSASSFAHHPMMSLPNNSLHMDMSMPTMFAPPQQPTFLPPPGASVHYLQSPSASFTAANSSGAGNMGFTTTTGHHIMASYPTGMHTFSSPNSSYGPTVIPVQAAQYAGAPQWVSATQQQQQGPQLIPANAFFSFPASMSSSQPAAFHMTAMPPGSVMPSQFS